MDAGPEVSGGPDTSGGASEIVVLRAGEASDHAFVTDSWLKSFWQQKIAHDAGDRYIHDMKWLVRAWLARCSLLVACDPEDTAAIWGWAVTRGDTILYVFVREQFREQGLAKLLLHPFLANVPGRRIVYAAKSSTTRIVGSERETIHAHVPRGWQYSFLAGLRILTE